MQVMGDFQLAQRKRLEEPVADIGLEPLCAIVRVRLLRISAIL